MSARSTSALAGRESVSLARRRYPCTVSWRNSNELLGGSVRVLVGTSPVALLPGASVVAPALGSAGAAPASLTYRYEGLKTGITVTAGGCLVSHLSLLEAAPLPGSASGGVVGSGSSTSSSSVPSSDSSRSGYGGGGSRSDYSSRSSCSGNGSGSASSAGSTSGQRSRVAASGCPAPSPQDATAEVPPYRRSLIVAVLGSSNKSTRFSDTHALAAWAVRFLHAPAGA